MSQGLRWAFNIKEWKPNKAQWELCLKCVQKEESERCSRFCFVDDCKSSMVGRLLMRKAVNESLAIAYEKISFARTDSGKPYLIGESQDKMSFNVSHHGDFCVLASELNIPVGVDVMKVEYQRKIPLSSYFETMEKQFSTYEWDFISLPGKERDQLERFFRLWCLKESYVKAVGTGITSTRNLQTISFSIKTHTLKCGEVVSNTKLFIDDILQNDWKFEESFLDNNHCVAVAVKAAGISNGTCHYNAKSFNVINYDELMRNSVPFQETSENFWENFISKKERK